MLAVVSRLPCRETARETPSVAAPTVFSALRCKSHGTNAYVMSRLLRKLRNAGGLRAAALYAIVDVVGKIRKDRTRFPFSVNTFGRADEPDRENMQRRLWATRKLSGG